MLEVSLAKGLQFPSSFEVVLAGTVKQKWKEELNLISLAVTIAEVFDIALK